MEHWRKYQDYSVTIETKGVSNLGCRTNPAHNDLPNDSLLPNLRGTDWNHYDH